MIDYNNYDRTTEILNSPFDIEVHKRYFKHYLEVIIHDDGLVEYATPSHQEKLIQICMGKLKCSRSELNAKCPEKYYLDFMAWLCKQCNCIAVYNDHYEGVITTSKQLNALYNLKMNKLYEGEWTNMRNKQNYVRYAQMQELDEPWYSLSDKSLFRVYCLGTMLEYNYTLRQASKELLVPKSTLHRWIHHDIKHVSSVMYDELIAMMRKHKHRR